MARCRTEIGTNSKGGVVDLPQDTRSVLKVGRPPRTTVMLSDDLVFVAIHIKRAGSILVQRFPSRRIVVCSLYVLLRLLLLTIVVVHHLGRHAHRIFAIHSFMLRLFLIIVYITIICII